MSYRNLVSCVFLLALLPTAASAAIREWPGGAGCTGTLQACIDGAANGDYIDIAQDAPIDEDLVLANRSLTLRAAAGFAPRLAAGRSIQATGSAGAGDLHVTIERIRLSGGGHVLARYDGSGTGYFTLRSLQVSGAAVAAAIRVEAGSGSAVEAQVHDNWIEGLPAHINGGLLELATSGGQLDARAYYNHVTSSANAAVNGAGIYVDVASGGSGDVTLHANSVRGGFFRGGIWVSEGLFSSTPSTLSAQAYNNVVVGPGQGDLGGSCIGFVTASGSINVEAVNNTATRCHWGLLTSRWSGSSGGAISGPMVNNLVVADFALSLHSEISSGVTNDYNLLNGGTPGVALGAHTITAPARLVSDGLPRLAQGSPAIEAGDPTTLGLGLIFNGIPVTDADGLRRYKDMGSNDPDIGAYEYGDTSLLHRADAGNISSNWTRISHPALDGNLDANVFATPNFGTGSGAVFNRPFGAWYPFPNWALFDEGVDPMVVSATFNVFAPAPGAGSLRHTTSASTLSGWSSQLVGAGLDDLPDEIVLALPNWQAGSVYYPYPIGVFYFGLGGGGSWFVTNLEQSELMPEGLGFNIYHQPASPNAFRVTAPAAGQSIRLNHPLLDGHSCAQVLATRMSDGLPATDHYDVYYDGANWRIFTYAPMNEGTQFNVLVDPAQVAACTDVIFADGLD
jgi:hypothetical protein